MPTVAVLHHLERPFTGHAGVVLTAAGMRLDERLVHAGEPLPDLDAIDGVLSLGGDQSVRDVGRLPYLEAEAAWLREAVARDVPVLGVCLGAQLLAHALGGEVDRLERRQLTWVGLQPLPAAHGDPVLGALPDGAHALHWNEDGFTLPPGAIELLRRPGPTVQGFRYGRRAWGVQFHPEVDAVNLEGWYDDWRETPGEAGVDVAAARALDRVHLPGQAALAEAIFGGFARAVAARRALAA